MKFEKTDYGTGKEILRFPDHFVSAPVTVNDVGVTVNAEGKKIVPKGTIVGGGVLADPTAKVTVKNTSDVAALRVLSMTGDNNDILIVAKKPGTDGNSISVTLAAPSGASQALSVSVSSAAITVNLATDAEAAVSSTAADVIAAINAHPAASLLVVAANAANNNGTGKVTALASTSLSDGSAGSGTEAEGVLLYDADVTYGPAACAMLIHGFVAMEKLPVAPSAAAKTALAGRVVFMK